MDAATQQKLLDYLIAQKEQKEKDEKPPEIQWLDDFLPVVITIATFGGSLTFSIIPSAPEPSSTLNKSQVTKYLALAWLFFLLALAWASMCSLVLAFNRKEITKRINTKERPKGLKPNQVFAVWLIAVFPVSLVLQILILLPFLFLGLVVLAYEKDVGTAAVAITGVAIVLVVIVWFVQWWTSDSSKPGKGIQQDAAQHVQEPSASDNNPSE